MRAMKNYYEEAGKLHDIQCQIVSINLINVCGCELVNLYNHDLIGYKHNQDTEIKIKKRKE